MKDIPYLIRTNWTKIVINESVSLLMTSKTDFIELAFVSDSIQQTTHIFNKLFNLFENFLFNISSNIL